MKKTIALALTLALAAACATPTEPTRPTLLKAGAKRANDSATECTTAEGGSGWILTSGGTDVCVANGR